MTTIAYKDGVLAGDGRLTAKTGHIWTDQCRKVYTLKNGELFGASGDDEAIELLMRGIEAGKKRVKVKGGYEAVRITPQGVIWTTEGQVWLKWPEPFIALGSGKEYALTALRLGFDAVTAVKQGIAGDMHSGGRIQTVKLKGNWK